MSAVENVLVVSGSATDWLAVAILAKLLQPGTADGVSITVLESEPSVNAYPRFTESSWPGLVDTLAFIGLDEGLFMRKCQATFKQATQFVDWSKPGHAYYHLFEKPLRGQGLDMASCWIGTQNPTVPFAAAVSPQGAICDGGYGPKSFSAEGEQRVVRYGYNFDCIEFAKLLREHCCKVLGVKQVTASIESINTDAEGFITSVTTAEAGEVLADLFVDGTGCLIEETLGVSYLDQSSMLSVDNSVSLRIPYLNENQLIPSYTIAQASEAGWVWSIPLSQGYEVGNAYASAYLSSDQAESALRDIAGEAAKNQELVHSSYKAGFRRQFWEKNCIGIGRAAGAVEPLESSSMAMLESMALTIATQFPRSRAAMNAVAKKYNQVFEQRWRNLLDFIKLHYVLSQRQDGEFWQDQVSFNSASSNLSDLVELWRHFPPAESDFSVRDNLFSLQHYQYILYGMGFATDVRNNPAIQSQMPHAKKAFMEVRAQAEQAIKTLPSHRQLIDVVAWGRESANQPAWAFMSR